MPTIQELDQKYGISGSQMGGAQQPQQNQGLLQRIIGGPLIPGAGAVLGGLGGTAVGGPGVGTGAGAFLGYGGGAAVQNSLKNLLGMQDKNSPAQFPQDLTNASYAGTGAALASEVPTALKAITNPNDLLGKLRSYLIGDKSVATPEMEQGVLDKLLGNRVYQMAPGESQIAAKGRMGNFLDNLNPTQTLSEGSATQSQQIGKPSTTLLNDIYKALNAFEQSNKPFTNSGDMPSTSIKQGSNLADRAIRAYMNENIPGSARMTNNVMSKISQFQASPMSKWIPRIGLGYLMYRAIPDLIKQIQKNEGN